MVVFNNILLIILQEKEVLKATSLESVSTDLDDVCGM